MKIYVASSWRNSFYDTTTRFLTEFGHEILDWRENGFSWKDVSESPVKEWSGDYYRDFVLQQPRAKEGFQNDFSKMQEADCCVLLLPSGRAAHIEAGWFWGQGKPLYIYIPVFDAPELMYRSANKICFTLEELAEVLQ